MAAKRFLEDNPGLEKDQLPEKRIKIRLASVIREVMVENSMKHVCKALEPMLRRVVEEEMELGLRRCTRSVTWPSTLELRFSNSLSLPIFTGTKIKNQDGAPLQILLVDMTGSPIVLPNPIKIEIVVIDGDFPSSDRYDWTSEEFDRSIVRTREGRRPLLAGDLSLVMRSNSITSVGELELTDNSSWIRSRQFRIGARVSPICYRGLRIREAVTEAFVVKDHRGELYKKHYPPSLNDKVWRLENIGKMGAFHRKLAAANINSVQDFLKLSVIDPLRLREILGSGMSEKKWEVTIKHARSCEMGTKRYIYRGHNFVIVLNPICHVEMALIDGQLSYARDHFDINQPYIENLVRQAYLNWDSLEETEGEVELNLPNPQMACLSSNTPRADNWHTMSEFASSPIEQYAIEDTINETS